MCQTGEKNSEKDEYYGKKGRGGDGGKNGGGINPWEMNLCHFP